MKVGVNVNKWSFFKKNKFFQNPKILQIEVTNICKLHCQECYKKESEFTNMDIETFKEIISEAKTMHVESVMLNGGEPLENTYFIDMVGICNDNGIKCTTFTSGYLVNSMFCNTIRNYNIDILVSLNGSTEKINSLSRDGYYVAVKAMETLNAKGIDFGVNWVARHDNVRDLEELITFSRRKGAKYINIVCNKLSSNKEIQSPCSRDDYIYMKKIILKYSQYIKIQNCYDLLISYVDDAKKRNELYGCSAGIYLMAVDLQKRYMPCTHLCYPEDAKNMKEYWIESKTLKRLRCKERTGICKECNKCRVCHAISERTYENFNESFQECPVFELRKETE